MTNFQQACAEDKVQFKELLNRLLKHFPSWEQVVMITVLFVSWWIADKFFKDLSIGKFIGILASLASCLLAF